MTHAVTLDEEDLREAVILFLGKRGLIVMGAVSFDVGEPDRPGEGQTVSARAKVDSFGPVNER